MKLLVTGSTGFLGKKIINYYKDYFIETIGRSNNVTYKLDLNKPIEKIKNKYDIVIHVAGKAHNIAESEIISEQVFNSNYHATLNLLNALEINKPKCFLYISSVAVYGLNEGELINEDNKLLATDPYGKSKALSEYAIIDWCSKFNVKYTILRLPLLVGEDAPGNLGSMIRSIKNGYYFNINGGKAKKSMVLVEDVVKYILKAAEIGGIYNLTDGYHPNFYEFSSLISNQLKKKLPLNMSLFYAKILAIIGDIIGSKFPINSIKLNKLNSTLTFDDSKARIKFGWNPTPVLLGFKLTDSNK